MNTMQNIGLPGTCRKCGDYIIFSKCKVCPNGKNGEFCCKYGDKCFKGCRNGISCQKYCKFMEKCRRLDCKYAHGPIWEPLKNQKICEIGPNCTRQNCSNFCSHPWLDIKEEQFCTIISKPQPQPQPFCTIIPKPQPQPLIIVTPLTIFHYNGRIQYNYSFNGVAFATMSEAPKMTDEQLHKVGTDIYPFIQSVIPGQVGQVIEIILDWVKGGYISFEELAGYTQNKTVNQSLVDKINEALKFLQNQNQ